MHISDITLMHSSPRLTGYLEPMRLRKSRRILGAFIAGAGGRLLSTQSFDYDAQDHVFYGQLWGAERLLPEAERAGCPYWHIDNGWISPGRGDLHGYYRVTRNGIAPAFLRGLDGGRAREAGAVLHPWRQGGGHVLLCLPGPNFGRPWGMDMAAWTADALERVRAATDRPVMVRGKDADRPLHVDLAGAWCIVTHSSNVAVDAVLAGIPAIVEPTSPTAPLGNVGMEWIESPRLSDLREEWLASLCWQQFTPAEMRSGFAWATLERLLSRDRAQGEPHARPEAATLSG